MSASKPFPLYFEQILEFIDARADECLMIGNDPVMDMGAAEKDILTFFIITEANQPVPKNADFSGKFSDLAKILDMD